jgi:hypothetical protein
VFTQDVTFGRDAWSRAWLNRAGRVGAVGVAVVGLLGAGCGGSQKRIPGVARAQPGVRVHLVRYGAPAGWSVRYPSFFHRESVPSFAGVALASFPLRGWRLRRQGPYIHSASVGLPLDLSGRFPKNGVALTMQPVGGFGPPPSIMVADSRFPLSLGAFVVRGVARAWRSFELPLPRLEGIQADGVGYIAEAWIGSAATQRLRGELAQIVSSLAFPRLQPGTVVGGGFAVLHGAGHYPVGTARRVEVPQRGCGGTAIVCPPAGGHTPLYLVHAPGRPARGFVPCQSPGVCVLPGAFYTVGENAWCSLRFDATDDQFYCPGTDRRWDRVGRQINAVHSLNLGFAKIAWDGHVVATLPGGLVAPPPPIWDIRSLWPRWRPGS